MHLYLYNRHRFRFIFHSKEAKNTHIMLPIWMKSFVLASSNQQAWIYWVYGVMGNQIRGKTELPDLCRCRGACARSTKNSWRASEDSGERRRGLFWWRGSINIALPAPRLLVCLLLLLPCTVHCSAAWPSKWRRHARLNGCVRGCNSANYLFSHTLFQGVRSDIEG